MNEKILRILIFLIFLNIVCCQSTIEFRTGEWKKGGISLVLFSITKSYTRISLKF